MCRDWKELYRRRQLGRRWQEALGQALGFCLRPGSQGWVREGLGEQGENGVGARVRSLGSSMWE